MINFTANKEFPAQYTDAIVCADINSGKKGYFNKSHINTSLWMKGLQLYVYYGSV